MVTATRGAATKSLRCLRRNEVKRSGRKPNRRRTGDHFSQHKSSRSFTRGARNIRNARRLPTRCASAIIDAYFLAAGSPFKLRTQCPAGPSRLKADCGQDCPPHNRFMERSSPFFTLTGPRGRRCVQRLKRPLRSIRALPEPGVERLSDRRPMGAEPVLGPKISRRVSRP